MRSFKRIRMICFACAIAATVATSFFLASCGNKVILEDLTYNDDFIVPSLDILFVIDNSNSMREPAAGGKSKLEHVRDTVKYFVSSYVGNDDNINYNIGITTIEGEGKLVGDVITSDLPVSTVKAKLEAAINDMIKLATIKIEMGLLAGLNAARHSYISVLNQEWYHAGNDLAIVVISDEDDSSGGDCSSVDGCFGWLSYLKTGYPGRRVSFHAIADKYESCLENIYVNHKAGSKRYEQMVKTSGGEFIAMCEPKADGDPVHVRDDFDEFFDILGKNLRSTFPLKVTPDLSTLEVYLDGVLQVCPVDYYYDDEKIAIVFIDGHYPKHGQRLEISYVMGDGI